jgi:hypothetical protein
MIIITSCSNFLANRSLVKCAFLYQSEHLGNSTTVPCLTDPLLAHRSSDMINSKISWLVPQARLLQALGMAESQEPGHL